MAALLASRRPPAEAPAAVGGSPRRAFLAGLISTVLNPKPALFFLTFLPQFVDRDAAVLPQTLTLSAIHVIVGLVWLSAYARLVHRAHGLLSAPRVKAWLERTTGAGADRPRPSGGRRAAVSERLEHGHLTAVHRSAKDDPGRRAPKRRLRGGRVGLFHREPERARALAEPWLAPGGTISAFCDPPARVPRPCADSQRASP